MSSNNTVKARIWESKGADYTFPEKDVGVKQNAGVCFSGGGTRALSAAMGQLRGLSNSGLLKKMDYISCVSGGSWASGAFTFYKTGAKNDAEFLGAEVAPDKITMAELNQISKSCLGYTATLSLAKALEELHGKVPDERLWIEAVGKVYYEPFGLHELNKPAGFSLNAKTVEAIKAANPALKDTEFHTVRNQEYRPYLIINSSLVGPSKLAPFHKEALQGFEYTPLYSGIPLLKDTKYDPVLHKDKSYWTGGGYLETFALGAGAPAKPFTNGSVELPGASSVFTLAEASGASSTAYADAASHLTAKLSPLENYWPVNGALAASQGGVGFSFADGGNLENYGLISLLLRGVKNIVVFINTNTPLSTDTKFKGDKAPAANTIDYNLPPLFGHPGSTLGYSMVQNQVFAQGEFPLVAGALQEAKKKGETVMAVTSLVTVPNAWWGLAGGEKVNVCWIYNDRVPAWEKQLSPDLQEAIKEGNPDKFWKRASGPVKNFPSYKTIGENGLPNLVELTPIQVNLLAHLGCWNVTQNADAIGKIM